MSDFAFCMTKGSDMVLEMGPGINNLLPGMPGYIAGK